MKSLTGSVFMMAFLLLLTQAGNGQTAAKNLAKNDNFEMVIQNKTLMTQEVMGQSMEINIDMNSTQAVVIKEKTDQATVFAVTVNKLKAAVSAGGQDNKYDSEDPSTHTGDMGQEMSKLLNKTKEVSVDNNGKKTLLTPPSEQDASAGMISQLTGGNKEDGGLGQFLFYKDLSGLKNGATWIDSTEGNGNKTVSTYTVKEMTGETITIGTESNTTTNSTVEQMGMEVAVTMSTKTTATTVYDLKSQRMVSGVSQTEGTGTADAAGMTIPLTVTSTSNATVTKK
jgi:hypothetical protein